MQLIAQDNELKLNRIIRGLVVAIAVGSAVGAMALDPKDNAKSQNHKNDKHEPVSVPEPATLVLLASGVAIAAARKFRKR